MIKNIKVGLNNLKINTNYESSFMDGKTPKNNESLTLSSNRKNNISAFNLSPKKTQTPSEVNKKVIKHSEDLNNINYNNGINNYMSTNARSLSKNNRLNTNNFSSNLNKLRAEIDLTNNSDNSLSTNKYLLSPQFPNSTKSQYSISTNNKLIVSPNNVLNKYNSNSTRNNGKISTPTNSIYNISSSNNNTNNSNTNNSENVNIMSLLASQNLAPIVTKNLTTYVPQYDQTKSSSKSMSLIKAYAANTHQGIVRYTLIINNSI